MRNVHSLNWTVVAVIKVLRNDFISFAAGQGPESLLLIGYNYNRQGRGDNATRFGWLVLIPVLTNDNEEYSANVSLSTKFVQLRMKRGTWFKRTPRDKECNFNPAKSMLWESAQE